MSKKKIHEGYGETSEQRQRHLENDNFSERAPHTPEELEEVRSSPEDEHEVVTLHPLGSEETQHE